MVSYPERTEDSGKEENRGPDEQVGRTPEQTSHLEGAHTARSLQSAAARVRSHHPIRRPRTQSDWPGHAQHWQPEGSVVLPGEVGCPLWKTVRQLFVTEHNSQCDPAVPLLVFTQGR